MSSLSPITARYAETDRMGVIHHAVYPVWYEVARTDYVRPWASPTPSWRKWGS